MRFTPKSKKIERKIWAALQLDLSDVQLRLEHGLLEEVAIAFQAWWPLQDNAAAKIHTHTERLLIRFLPIYAQQCQRRIEALNQAAAEFQRLVIRTPDEIGRKRLMLNFVTELGGDRKQRRRDKRAFGDFFAPDVLLERGERRVAFQLRLINRCLERLGTLLLHQLLENPDREAGLWRLWRFDRFILKFLDVAEPRVATTALTALGKALIGLPAEVRYTCFDDDARNRILQIALDLRQDVWMQCAAWGVLANLSPELLENSLRQRGRLTDQDDLFVRHQLVKLCGQVAADLSEIMPHLYQALADPSPFVRQAVAQTAHRLKPVDSQRVMARLLCDQEPCVQAAALAALPRLVRDSAPMLDSAKYWLIQVLLPESPKNALRYALKAAVDIARQLSQDQVQHSTAFCRALLPNLDQLALEHEEIAVRRWAAQARYWLNVLLCPIQLELLNEIAPMMKSLQRRRFIALQRSRDFSPDDLARVLSLLAEDSFGFDMRFDRREIRIYRQQHLAWRIWRFLHEWRHPSTDKRQAHRHTVGRRFRGNWQMPAPIMAELSETKVPGEPLYIDEEAGWRPFLPLPDVLISACGWSSQSTRVVTPQGVTRVIPPRSLIARMWTRMRLSWHLPRLSRLRNWRGGTASPAHAYVQAAADLGVQIEFSADIPAETGADSSVTRFFAPVVILPPDLLERFAGYFVSIYENSLRDLLLFLIGMTSVFIGRHLWSSYRMRRYRRSIPLVIGGWGTRGKSGTERLKAALFNAMGYTVVSKTTGCEAMFVYSHPYGPPKELFLFRPYDKATIWEQVDVMGIASELHCEVFLWECMGLTPSYVRTLQRQWMRDDLATITNTYPDHEDLQGPAGIDIPKVMTEFIPDRSELVTTEEQMHPLLVDAAELRQTSVHCVGWHEAGLIPPDIIKRFPYEEHPYNMALVVRMAQCLGIPREYALKEMADRVVADLGVLKAYPAARRAHRSVEFVMGNSANERLGTMGNWKRMGFADFDPWDSPGTMTSTLINNRADRIARSKVFASILVNDIRADRHVLIGTNLDGLMAYVREAWDELMAGLSLWSDTRSAPEVLRDWAERLHIATDQPRLLARVGFLFEAQGLSVPEQINPDSIQAALAQLRNPTLADDIRQAALAFAAEHAAYAQLADKLTQGGDKAALDQEFKAQLWNWFEAHLVVIHDEHASAESIIAQCYQMTPPGYHNRIMGMQNIKGTGLGFVYAWQAWEACFRACAQALSLSFDDAPEPLQGLFADQVPRVRRPGDTSLQDLGLKTLAGFMEFNTLCEQTVAEVVAFLKSAQKVQDQASQLNLASIERHLAEQVKTVDTVENQAEAGWLRLAFTFAESFLDAGDAVARRRRARKIYRELGQERISTARATAELMKLTKRQKGGWLRQDIQRRVGRFTYELVSRLRRQSK